MQQPVKLFRKIHNELSVAQIVGELGHLCREVVSWVFMEVKPQCFFEDKRIIDGS